MAELLSGLVPGLPEQLRDGILQRAEGVPLYAVETVRMLIDRGVLTRDGDTYRVPEAVPALEVPETLHALIAARLDNLTPAERGVVQNASVLGKMFTVPAVADVAGMDQAALLPLLASLVRKEMLSVQADPRSPERGQYGFLQDLVRRVAYERLPKQERKAKHLAAAEHLATAWAEDEGEIAEILASHYLEAYAAAPHAPDAPKIQGRARETLTQAGDRAGSLGANGEAQRYFEQAAGLEEDQLARARLLERAGQAAHLTGSLGAARAHYDAATEAFRARGEVRATARLAARLGDIDYEEGRLAEGIDRMEQAFAVLSQDEPDEDLATLAATLGRLHFFKADMDVARRRLETALDIAEPLVLLEVISQALNTKAVVGLYQGRVEENLALLRHALEIAVEHDLSTAALRAYVNLAETLFRRDRYEESLEKYQEGIALARRVGNRFWEIPLVCERLFALFMVGRWHEALQSAAEIPEADLARGDIIGPVLVLPAIHVARGNLPAARHVLSVCARFESSDSIQERAAYAIGRAVVLRAEGHLDRALEAADEAVSLGRRIEPPDGHMVKMGLDLSLDIAFDTSTLPKVQEILAAVEALRPGEITPSLRGIEARARARLAVHNGARDVAESMFSSAAATFRELGMPLWVATTLTDQAEWLRQDGRAQQADQIGAEAAAIFERLEATPSPRRVTGATPSPVPVSAEPVG
jgi:tetratricopeptide (TPR) repeat protein